jgi:hypothetical protein
VVRSRPIALELKKARGKPTPLQALRLKDLRDAGCYAWIVRSPHEACEAVYWVAKGWTRPLSNEPLDLNAWLMGDPPRAEAPAFEPNAQTPPVLDTAAPGWPDVDTLGSPPNYKVPPEEWDTPEHQADAAKALGYESAEQRTGVGLLAEIKSTHADVRAVGDRVTIVWERLSEYLAVLQALDAKVSSILGMIEEDPGLEPNGAGVEVPTEPAPPVRKPRTRKPRAEAEEPKPEEPRPEDLIPL